MRFLKKAICMGTIRSYLLFVLMTSIILGGCGSKRRTVIDRQEQERRMEQRYQESEKILEDARKKHYNMQTPDTQRRMRETRKKSDNWTRGKPPFYIRWYRSVVSLFK